MEGGGCPEGVRPSEEVRPSEGWSEGRGGARGGARGAGPGEGGGVTRLMGSSKGAIFGLLGSSGSSWAVHEFW